MKNITMIFFAVALLLATLEADGKRLILKEEERKLLLSGQASAQLDGKADVGAVGRTAEDNKYVCVIDSQKEEDSITNQLHQARSFNTAWNPFDPRQRKLRN